MRRFLAPLLAAALPLQAAAAIVPANPLPFETVSLRMTVDSCVYDPVLTRVDSMQGNSIIIASPRRNCFVAGTPEVVDIRLGQFPPGQYSVSVHNNPSDFAPPYLRETFEVRAPAEIAIFPPPARPLADYNGLWWNPQESGWGVSIHQGPHNNLFAMLFVYGSGSQPEWYTLQAGRWTSATMWTGNIYRTTGPPFAAAIFDASLVQYTSLGPATLEFKQLPGQEGIAHLTYTIGDAVVSKTIQRLAL